MLRCGRRMSRQVRLDDVAHLADLGCVLLDLRLHDHIDQALLVQRAPLLHRWQVAGDHHRVDLVRFIHADRGEDALAVALELRVEPQFQRHAILVELIDLVLVCCELCLGDRECVDTIRQNDLLKFSVGL